MAPHNTESFSSSFPSFSFTPPLPRSREYYVYLSLASMVQGLPPTRSLRRTLSERPLEEPVKDEKGLTIPLPHLAPYRGS
jgi:hypothetical protein